MQPRKRMNRASVLEYRERRIPCNSEFRRKLGVFVTIDFKNRDVRKFVQNFGLFFAISAPRSVKFDQNQPALCVFVKILFVKFFYHYFSPI